MITIVQTLSLNDEAEIAILAQDSQIGDINSIVSNLQAEQSRA